MSLPFYRVQNGSKLHLTLGGIYNYDNTIFDDIDIPQGVDKNTLVTEILRECGGNESRYQNPKILKTMIENFFHTNAWRYSELWKTTQYDYEPLVNYDLEITETRESKNNINGNRSVNSSGNISEQGNSENEKTVSAYNSNGYSPDEKNTIKQTNSNSSRSSGTETEKRNEDGNETITRHEKGDNSARSTQYMIKEQRDVVDFNFYKLVADEFEDELTLPIYYRTGVNIFEN